MIKQTSEFQEIATNNLSSMRNRQKNSQPKADVLRTKSFVVEKFINFLIIMRYYLVQVPLWIWAIILILLYALKLKREGNIPSSIFVVLAIASSLLGQLFENNLVSSMAPILAGISHIFSNKIYWFPKLRSLVGMKQHTLESDTYLVEFFPVRRNQNTKKRVIPWNYRLQMKRILEHQQDKGKIFQVFITIFTSAWRKVKLILAEGDQIPSDQAIVFSHGRGSTPLSYSQILTRCVNFQSENFNVYAVQHNEKVSTGQTQVHKIKRFRQIEVQARAAQMYHAVEYCKGRKRIIMMGHSYGGATTVQTYHCLPADMKQKVSHLIHLDPWLFSLTDEKLRQQINCPVLILANEYFLENEDVYNRNRDFIQSHKSKKDRMINLVWKKGDHLHQTDLCFMLGNILNRVKHPELSLEMLNKNIRAIEIFIGTGTENLNEQKMREAFKEDILPVDFKPLKWNNYLSL